MAATIVRQRKLRTGSVSFMATSADDTDEYLVVVSERCSKEKVAELFIAYSGNPIPKETLKQLGANYLICESVSASVASQKASLVFKVTVTWKEIESSAVENQSSPSPNSGSVDPEDWTPTWSKRTQVIFEPAKVAFYKGGFNGAAHAKQNGFAGKTAPLENSAGVPFETPVQARRRIYIWNFRWLRATLPANLMDKEGKANSVAFSFAIGGRTFTFNPRTAFIDTIDLSKHRWGNVNLVEVSMEIVHDPAGIYWRIRDEGYDERVEAGDLREDGTIISINDLIKGNIANLRKIRDQNNKQTQDPQPLNGNGKLLQPNEAPFVYGEWSDFEEVDFEDVPLLNQL